MQVQITTQQEAQLQTQKFTVQQDFKNVIGIGFELQAVLNYFKDQPDHPMLPIQMNRMILQLNLSNCIHYDTLFDSQEYGLTKPLSNSKQLCTKILTQIRNQVEFSPEVEELLEAYIKNSLQEKVILNQLTPKQVQVQAEFNEGSVQKVINSIGSVDEQYQQIKNGQKIEDLNLQSVLDECEKRRKRAEGLLNINWPIDTQIPILPMPMPPIPSEDGQDEGYPNYHYGRLIHFIQWIQGIQWIQRIKNWKAISAVAISFASVIGIGIIRQRLRSQ